MGPLRWWFRLCAAATIAVQLWCEAELHRALSPLDRIVSRCVQADPATGAPYAAQQTPRAYQGGVAELFDAADPWLAADWRPRVLAAAWLPAEWLPSRWAGPPPRPEDCPAVRAGRGRSAGRPPEGHRQVPEEAAGLGNPSDTIGRTVVLTAAGVSVSPGDLRRMADRDFGIIGWPSGTVVAERVMQRCRKGRWRPQLAGSLPSVRWHPAHAFIGTFKLEGRLLAPAAADPVWVDDPAAYDLALSASTAGFVRPAADGWLYSPPEAAAGGENCSGEARRARHRWAPLSNPATIAARHPEPGVLEPDPDLPTARRGAVQPTDLLRDAVGGLLRDALRARAACCILLTAFAWADCWEGCLPVGHVLLAPLVAAAAVWAVAGAGEAVLPDASGAGCAGAAQLAAALAAAAWALRALLPRGRRGAPAPPRPERPEPQGEWDMLRQELADGAELRRRAHGR